MVAMAERHGQCNGELRDCSGQLYFGAHLCCTAESNWGREQWPEGVMSVEGDIQRVYRIAVLPADVLK